jgi:flagellar biosynthesis protein FliR
LDLLLSQPLLETWLLVFARLLGWAWVDPLVSRLSWGMRVFVAGALAWAWVPGSVHAVAGVDPLSIPGLISLLLTFLTGAAMGFAVRLLVAAAEAALSYLGLAANLGLTQINPDQPGGLDGVLRALAWWLALLAFFSANGHLLVMQALAASFAAVPPDALLDAASAMALVKAGSLLFASALQLAMPVLVLVLLVQMAFAVLSRMLPGVDGFSVGLTLGVFGLLGGLAMAVPVMTSVLMLKFAAIPALLPQFGP